VPKSLAELTLNNSPLAPVVKLVAVITIPEAVEVPLTFDTLGVYKWPVALYIS